MLGSVSKQRAQVFSLLSDDFVWNLEKNYYFVRKILNFLLKTRLTLHEVQFQIQNLMFDDNKYIEQEFLVHYAQLDEI